MKPSTLILWLLVAACVAIDLAMIGELQIRRNEWPEAGGVIGLGLVFSQIATLVLWAVWGRHGVSLRAVVTLLGIWGVSCLASYSTEGGLSDVGEWFGVLLVYAGVCLVPFILARFLNYDLSGQDTEPRHTTPNRLSSKQFTIWGLMSLMTAIGIALAVIRFAQFPMQQVLEVVAFFAILAGTVCTVLSLALFLSKVRYAIIATALICPIAGVLLSLPDLAPGEGPLELVLMTCTLGVATLAAASAIRVAGYRLVRVAAQIEATASESSEVAESAVASAVPYDEP